MCWCQNTSQVDQRSIPGKIRKGFTGGRRDLFRRTVLRWRGLSGCVATHTKYYDADQ